MWRLVYLIQIAAGGEMALPTFVPPPCERANGDEIVVCKPRGDSARFGPRLPDRDTRIVPDAQFRLFGQARVGVAGQQRSVGGFSAPAAMGSIRVPF